MEKATKQGYRSLRVKADTLETLQDVKLAFESAYLSRMTNDELVGKLVACIEDAEPAVWESYCLIRQKKEGGV